MNGRMAAVATGALAVIAVLAPTAHAQGHQYVMRMGRDTVAIERITRTPGHIEGDLLSPMLGVRSAFAFDLTPDQRVAALTLATGAAGDSADAPPRQRATFHVVGDSVHAELAPGGLRSYAVARGALPLLAALEQVVNRARVLAHDTATVELFALGNGQAFTAEVSGLAADTADLRIATQLVRLVVDRDGHLRGGAIPAQNITIAEVPFASGPLAQAKRDYSAPAGAPYTAEDVRVPTAAGFTLAGTVTRPAGVTRRVPCVVTITGSGLEDRDEAIPLVSGYRPFRQIADALARRGIATLRLDDRGFGESGGDATHATSADFADDVRDALKWLRAQPWADGGRLALIGHSEGGLIAPLVAARDRSVKALVLMAAPARTGRRIVEYQARYAIDRDSSLTPAARDSLMQVSRQALATQAAALPWWQWFLDYDPVPTARLLRVPVLILQGATDRQVEAVQADELAAAIRAGGDRDVTVRVLPDVNHLFLDDPSGDPARYPLLEARAIRPEILDIIGEFLVSRLHVAR
jgi:dienelactone hydrolase